MSECERLPRGVLGGHGCGHEHTFAPVSYTHLTLPTNREV